jgi:hypothetical protein
MYVRTMMLDLKIANSFLGFNCTPLEIIKYLGKCLPNRDIFQYTRTKVAGYSMNRQEMWQHQVFKSCVNF